MKAMTKNCSVIVPTLGREKEVIDTVRALTEQSRVPDEIIIIDQNNPPHTELTRYLASVPIVRHLRSKTKGVVFNMNVGLGEAKGEIVLFVDDDVVPDSTLVEKHLANYSADEATLGGIAGRVETQAGDPDPRHIKSVGSYNRWSGDVKANFNALEHRRVMFAQGANMSFRREALARAGGFDLGFEGNGYFFEPDACMRVGRAGFRMEFDPTAKLTHLMAASGGCRVSDKAVHTFYFVRNGFRLYRRFSPTIGLPFFISKMFLYVLAKTLYNRNLRIFSMGLKAIAAGLTQNMSLKTNFSEQA